ncbi:hypothetical protein JCM10213v2_005285 [Rhodosporidiobolus nylandii]
MPVPSLPLELIELILSHLVSPLTLDPPDFYNDLRSASLVCKVWMPVAQKLLWKAVYLGGEEQANRFLAVEEKAKMSELVLCKQGRREDEERAWTTGEALRVFERCPHVDRLVCTLPLHELDELQGFFGLSFPHLQRLELLRPNQRQKRLSPAIPIPLHSPFHFSYQFLLTDIFQDPEPGLLPLLTSLTVQDSKDLPILKILDVE